MGSKRRILTVIGTRPEAVKMGPVMTALAHSDSIESLVCVTGQHRDLLDPFLHLFGIQPDFDLNLMLPNQSLSRLSAEVFIGLEPILMKVRPDWVLLQGDTTSAAAAALAASQQGMRVAHVEAGLRTGDIGQPFPEEINRRVVGAVAGLHFAHTEGARQNLLKENVPPDAIFVTGNPGIDAFQAMSAAPYDVENGSLAGIPWERRIVLVTVHRRESFGRPMERIMAAIGEVSEKFSDEIQMVLPVHPNPNVRGTIQGKMVGLKNVSLIEPLDYPSMVHIINRADLIMTDSGGLQEEACEAGVPVLVMREKTERPEAIEIGIASLVGTDPDRIVSESSRLLREPPKVAGAAKPANPFGDGHAAVRIVKALLDHGD